jgi:hypothetical protein
MKTTQMIIWLAAAMAVNPSEENPSGECKVVAADVVAEIGDDVFVSIYGGKFKLKAAHTCEIDNGDVSQAVALVDKAQFLDLRAII